MAKLYSNYDYVTAFDHLIYDSARPKRTDEEETNRLAEAEAIRMIKNKARCVYATATYKSGGILESNIYPAFHCIRDIPPTRKKKHPSSQRQKNLNDKNARRAIARKINHNFVKNDYWFTAGYNHSDYPESPEQAHKDIVNFFKRINRRLKKTGQPNVKYIYVTEYNEPTEDDKEIRIHHHIVMSCPSLSRDEIEEIWGMGDRPHCRGLKPNEHGCTGIAMYITKDPKGKKRWGCSIGLRTPPDPTKSMTKFSRKKVEQMVRDQNSIPEIFEKAYPGYKFGACEICYNKIADAFYLYVQMYKPELTGGEKHETRGNRTIHSRTIPRH